MTGGFFSSLRFTLYLQQDSIGKGYTARVSVHVVRLMNGDAAEGMGYPGVARRSCKHGSAARRCYISCVLNRVQMLLALVH